MGEAIWNLFFFIIVIGVLVTIHELGHFWVARWSGVKIYRFSIGFGPVLFKRVGKDGTEYALSLIPLGGYVKMKGEAEDPLQRHDPSLEKESTQDSSNVIAQTDFAEFRSGYESDEKNTDTISQESKTTNTQNDRSDSFIDLPCYRRFLILFAGPFSNILLAFILFVVCNLLGVEVFKPVVGDILPNSVAEKAGLQTFDLVQKVGDQEVYDWGESMTELLAHASETITLTVSADKGTGPSRTVTLDLTEHDFSPEASPFKHLGFVPCYGTISHALVKVLEDGAAYQQGIQEQDRIFAIDGELTTNWSTIQSSIDQKENANHALQFSVLRKIGTPKVNHLAPDPQKVDTALVNGQEFTVEQLFAFLKEHYPKDTLTLELKNEDPQDYEILNFSIIPEVVIDPKTDKMTLRVGIGTGVEPDPTLSDIRQYGLIESLALGAHTTARMSVVVLTALKKLVVGDIDARNVNGPIAIAKGAGMSASFGVVPFLWFLAAISINLGVFNLLPLPILDGGQIVYVLYEAITKRKPNVKMQNILTLISLSLLLSLMMFSIFNDLSFL